jgi:hypothetical protein
MGLLRSSCLKDWKSHQLLLWITSYHSTLAGKTPNCSWRKDSIKSWLQERHILFTNGLLNIQLLEIVSRYRYT